MALRLDALVLCAVCIHWTSASALSQNSVRFNDTDVRFGNVTFGQIVGGEYNPASKEFVLYATEAGDGAVTTLYVDDVADLALAASCCPEYGFSLEFLRDGSRPFTRNSLANPIILSARVLKAETPIAARLLQFATSRDRAALDHLAKMPTNAALSRKDLDVLVRLLNQARNELEPGDDSSRGDAAPAQRRNRLLLEDAFADEIVRDLASRYEIRYLPLSIEKQLVTTLSSSRVEKTLLTTDRALKEFAYGVDVPRDLNTGASQVFLCSQDLSRWIASGKTIDSYSHGEFALFYELTAAFDFDGFEHLGIWVKEPKIVVRAASRKADVPAPACVQRFAEILTGAMDKVLAHSGSLGIEFRRLRAILVLNRILGWSNSIFVPIDRKLLSSFQREHFENVPPEITKFPLLFVQDGRIQGMAYTGGVHLQTQAAPAANPPGRVPTPQTDEVRSDPSFVVTRELVGDRRLLKIDISTVLGLYKN